MDANTVGCLARNASAWYHAHRCGNGEMSRRQQAAITRATLERLCKIPSAPDPARERQGSV